DDAQRDGDTIHGVLRGIGTSNDAKGTGLLAPNPAGQVRAMRAAYAMSGLTPNDISLVECHATGTPVGDATEVRSLSEVYEGLSDVPLGSLKSNLGHLITVAGAAAVLKMTLCMEHGVRPPTLHAWPSTPSLNNSPFRLLAECEEWPKPDTDERRAAISAFGFGGNNAHVILEQHTGQQLAQGDSPSDEPIAIVAMASRTAAGPQMAQLEAVLNERSSVVSGIGARIDHVDIPLLGLGFPPSDLDHALGQQLAVLQAGREALANTTVQHKTTGVYIGMGCDPEISRYGTRARLAGRLHDAGVDVRSDWLDSARSAISGPLQSAGVLGCMPNILANRLNHVGDLGAGSGSISAEELSGIVALQRAVRGLRSGELDAAVVGASDMCCEPVHTLAMNALAPQAGPSGDAAVVLVLKRLADAQNDNDTVYAVINDEPSETRRAHTDLVPLLGHTGSASGLLAVVAAAIEAWRGRVESVTVDVRSFTDRSASVHLRAHQPAPTAPWPSPNFPGPVRSFPLHMPAVQLPPFESAEAQHMPKSPELPAIASPWVQPSPAPAEGIMPAPPSYNIGGHVGQAAPPQNGHIGRVSHAIQALDGHTPTAAPSPQPIAAQQPATFQLQASYATPSVTAHQQVLRQMATAHEQWMAAMAQAQVQFMSYLSSPMPQVHAHATPGTATPVGQYAQVPMQPAPVSAQPAPIAVQHAPAPAPNAVQHAPAAEVAAVAAPTVQRTSFPGPSFTRAELEHLSSGNISELFGAQFEPQDQYARQTRMPMPPLLLADRVLGIDAVPAVLGKGVLWTETDVPDADGWFMHNGRMPPGIMIESGQADLLLISWMGIDLLNKGDRVYRLLGCDVTFKGSAPSPGETLRYEIAIDGHANQGPIRLMFFHYDCTVNGDVRMEVRGGQAGFFTRAELDDSAGILWDPSDDDRSFDLPISAPRHTMTKTSLSEKEVAALAQGDLVAAFGPAWQPTRCHTRTPTIDDDNMRFIDRVTHLDLTGGPWKRGYLRCELDITPESWFFSGHFKNDPCMPGTLMLEGALQAMSIMMMAQGVTIDRDGWRFEPVTDHSVPLRCRGQVVPTSERMVLEIFVDSFIDDDGQIVMYADLLGRVDGL
ncbi:MAG: acyl transferase domain-containing protein, partial [Kiritimatiellia bacterium]